MRLVWSKASFDDRDVIMDHIAADDVVAAVRLDERIEAVANDLLLFPEMGRPGRVNGTRELVIAQSSYIIGYCFDAVEGNIFILRVLHGAQQWPQILD